jgi:hypothetical protein
MGLLATLGLTPSASMVRATMGAMVEDGPSRQSAAAGASMQDQWAVDPTQAVSHEVATPYGTYYIDWQNQSEVVPWVEDMLAAFPSAKAAHVEMLKVAAQLAKAKKMVEAQPHDVDSITADVTAHTDVTAAGAAETAENSKNLTKLVIDQVKAAQRDLIEVQKDWEVAASQLSTAGDRQQATELREQVAKEKDAIDQGVKALTDLLEACMKGASGAGAVEYIGMAVSKVVEAVHLVNGRERLARADALEKKAQAAAMDDLARAVKNAASRLEGCAAALAALETDLADFREDQVRQRDRAAIDFDAGSKGAFRMKELVKAMKAAEGLNARAEVGLREAIAFARTGGALARATPRETARYDDDRMVLDRMLKEARRWKESAEKEIGRSERLLVFWASLCDAALAAMVLATGRGKSIAAELALD